MQFLWNDRECKILFTTPLPWDFIAFEMNIISIRKCIIDVDVVSDATCTGWRPVVAVFLTICFLVTNIIVRSDPIF